MPIAKFQFPDGRVGRFEVPEGTSAEEAQAQIEAMVQQQEAKAPPPAPPQAAPVGAPAGGNDALKVLGEFAAAANRSVTETVDFLGPGAINAILRLAGSDFQLPTVTGALESTGIQGGFMEPGATREVVQAAGALLPAAASMVSVPRSAATVGGALADFVGAGSSMATTPVREAGKMVAGAVSDTVDNLPAVMPGERARRAAAELPIKRQSGDVAAAGYRLNQAGKAIPDPVQKEVINQGIEPRLVAMVKSSTAKGKEKMRAMLDNVDAQRSNLLNANRRPSNVAGDSILSRVKVIQSANKAAGIRMRPVVESLKGKTIDPSPAVDEFMATLNDMGVAFDPAKRTIDFAGSTIDELPGPTAAVKKILTRMFRAGDKLPPAQAGQLNAYEAHKLKRYIDEVVTYGRGAEGLAGETERMLKTLRYNLNQILQEASPEYKRVNTQYSETIQALDTLQDIAGKKMDLMGDNADRALGVLSRRIFSNAASGVPLDDALDEIDSVARKYVSPGGTELVPYKAISKKAGVLPDDLDDSLREQIQFASQMERYFKIAPSNSLQGVNEKFADIAMAGMTGNKAGVISETITAVRDKMRGVSEENAMKALRRLLED